MTNIVFSELEEFEKEFNSLLNKYPSLKDDIKLLKEIIELKPTGQRIKKYYG